MRWKWDPAKMGNSPTGPPVEQRAPWNLRAPEEIDAQVEAWKESLRRADGKPEHRKIKADYEAHYLRYMDERDPEGFPFPPEVGK